MLQESIASHMRINYKISIESIKELKVVEDLEIP